MNKEDKDSFFAELTNYLEAKDAVFMLDGPSMVTVKLKDNTWRKKTVGQVELWLSSIYTGAKDLIFCFQFEELNEEFAEIAQVEVSAKDMDTVFPMFLTAAQDWARDRYVSRDASRLQPILGLESVKALVNMVLNFEKDDAIKDTAESDDSLASHPNFGMF